MKLLSYWSELISRQAKSRMIKAAVAHMRILPVSRRTQGKHATARTGVTEIHHRPYPDSQKSFQMNNFAKSWGPQSALNACNIKPSCPCFHLLCTQRRSWSERKALISTIQHSLFVTWSDTFQPLQTRTYVWHNSLQLLQATNSQGGVISGLISGQERSNDQIANNFLKS